MNKPLVKNISLIAGVGLIFVSGLLYVLLADIVINTQSLWLMIAIIFAFGAAICTMISDNFKDGKKRVMYALKGIAVGFCVCFITFLVVVMLVSFSPAKEVVEGQKVSAFVEGFAVKRVQLTGSNGKLFRDGLKTLIVYLVSIIMAFIGLIGQVLDLVLTATIKEE